MNRRDFLKVSSLFSAALFVPISSLPGKTKNKPVELEYKGLLFRGTHDGEIHTSRDFGQTWQLHTRLGSGYAVSDLFIDWSHCVRAQIAFAGRSFDLVLAKGSKNWMTA